MKAVLSVVLEMSKSGGPQSRSPVRTQTLRSHKTGTSGKWVSFVLCYKYATTR